MTQTEYNNISDLILSPDVYNVSLGYDLIVTDEKFNRIKTLFPEKKYDNSSCKTIGDTIAKLCIFIEHVSADNTNMKGTWPVLRESLYMPAGIQYLNTMKAFLLE